MFLILSEDISLERVWRKRIWRKRGSSVIRHLPLVLEVPGSIPACDEENFGVQTRFP